MLLAAILHAADIQDRDGGVLLMSVLFGAFPFLLKLYADGGYQGPQFRKGVSCVCRQVDVEIVKRSDTAGVFDLTQTLGGRAHHRLAEPVPPPGKGLGMPEPQRTSIPTQGLCSPDAERALSKK